MSSLRTLLVVLACALAPLAVAAGSPAPAPPDDPAPLLREDADDGRSLEGDLRELQARVAELRERASRSRARLAGLQELVTGEDAALGARARVRHRNEMGAGYALEAVTYALDGAPVFADANASGDLERRPELEVFAGRLAPGHHVLTAKLVYRAAADGQRVQVEASHAFDAKAGQLTTIQAVGHEKKGATAAGPAAIRFRVDAEPERAAPGAGAARR
jgi:hypothetical protein